jgi:ABC-type transport system involved in multi-copper enzyme maturation permease subunit
MSRIAAFNSIALTGFREASRNRVTTVVLIFAAILVLSASLVTEVVITTFFRIVTDVGLGWMSITLTILAIFLSSGLIGKEIERRTIFLVVSKPVSRTTFFLARFAGTVLTLTALQAAMVVLFIGQLLVLRCPVTAAHCSALWGMWLELVVLAAAGFLFSSFAGTTVSALCTTGVFFLGHLSPDLYNLATRSGSNILRWIGQGLYYALPNLERMNFRPLAAYNIAVAPPVLLATAGYALAYMALLLAAGCLVFQRRDFK